ncbi:hypothetical protein JCM6882_001454 [Rhodosporidiobolus microsporus]
MLFRLLLLLATLFGALASPLPLPPPALDPLAAPVLLASPSSNTSNHPLFDQIVAFGDQWSDDGTGAFRLTGGEWPADPAYYGSRFTNGLTWVEQLARGLSVPSSSLATAGATTNNSLAQGMTGPGWDTPVRSVNEQVSLFVKSTPVRPNALFVLQGGLNDFLFGQYDGVKGEEAAESLGNAMLQLLGYGAQNILLLNLPSLLHFPYTSTQNPFARTPLNNFTRSFRNALYAFDEQREQVAIVDWYALFEGFWDRPEVFGWGERTLGRACLTGIYGECPDVSLCSTPTTYVWFDQFNPTNQTHFYMASLAYNVLRTQGWVELR